MMRRQNGPKKSGLVVGVLRSIYKPRRQGAHLARRVTLLLFFPFKGEFNSAFCPQLGTRYSRDTDFAVSIYT